MYASIPSIPILSFTHEAIYSDEVREKLKQIEKGR